MEVGGGVRVLDLDEDEDEDGAGPGGTEVKTTPREVHTAPETVEPRTLTGVGEHSAVVGVSASDEEEVLAPDEERVSRLPETEVNGTPNWSVQTAPEIVVPDTLTRPEEQPPLGKVLASNDEVEVDEVEETISMVSGKVKGNCASKELTEDEMTGSSQYGEYEQALAVLVASESDPEHPLVVVQVEVQVSEALEETMTVEHVVEQVEYVTDDEHSDDDEDEVLVSGSEAVSVGSPPLSPPTMDVSSCQSNSGGATGGGNGIFGRGQMPKNCVIPLAQFSGFGKRQPKSKFGG